MGAHHHASTSRQGFSGLVHELEYDFGPPDKTELVAAYTLDCGGIPPNAVNGSPQLTDLLGEVLGLPLRLLALMPQCAEPRKSRAAEHHYRYCNDRQYKYGEGKYAAEQNASRCHRIWPSTGLDSEPKNRHPSGNLAKKSHPGGVLLAMVRLRPAGERVHRNG